MRIVRGILEFVEKRNAVFEFQPFQAITPGKQSVYERTKKGSGPFFTQKKGEKRGQVHFRKGFALQA